MLHPISISDLKFNPFDLIGKDWYLVTSGTPDNYNTMTASWGTMGIFWGETGGEHLHPSPTVHP